MASLQSTRLERKKFFSDPVMVSMIAVLLIFLALFILYPLFMLLIDSFYTEGTVTLDVFKRVLNLERFQNAFKNTLVLGFITGTASTAIGLLFAYVEVYVKLKTKVLGKLFGLVSMLPVVSPPFVLSLSMIMLFGRSGLISRSLLQIYDSNVYGLKGIAIVQTLTFFPVCYLMLKGLLKNIDPSLEEATRDMGATRWKVFSG
ncbi:ABC transporter permease, partial [Lacrimispora sp.]|uniref:ABC transporter permease n=1 Tax=Lacrimispora sp. TaxID=2719234 RepID=UPI0028AB0A8B